MRFWLLLRGTIVGDDVFPFGGVGSGHDRDHVFGVAQVGDLVRHAGLDVDKVTGLILNDLLQAVGRTRGACCLARYRA